MIVNKADNDASFEHPCHVCLLVTDFEADIVIVITIITTLRLLELKKKSTVGKLWCQDSGPAVIP